MEVLLEILIVLKWLYIISVFVGMCMIAFLRDGIEKQHEDDAVGSQGGVAIWFVIILIPIGNTLFILYVLRVLFGSEPNEQENIDT